MHSKLPWGPSVSAVLERLKLKPACPWLDSEDGNDRCCKRKIQHKSPFGNKGKLQFIKSYSSSLQSL
jgi:hypothetical protein